MTKREAIAKLAEMVSDLYYQIRESGPLSKEEREAAAIAKEFGQPENRRASDPNYGPGGQWSGGPGMPYGS